MSTRIFRTHSASIAQNQNIDVWNGVASLTSTGTAEVSVTVVDDDVDEDSDFVPSGDESSESSQPSLDIEDLELIAESTWQPSRPSIEANYHSTQVAELPEGWYRYEGVRGVRYGLDGRLQAGVNRTHSYIDASFLDARNRRLLLNEERNQRATKRDLHRHHQ
ncbi:unnamed protein product [Phytophthora fragariaefolia]|uniref:Unnamed protein product n=1 Tax=Phytophthora fragariaefolia TaxID=1490495 RepID=A0A9W6Y256_9STRA|nr:unnamed protein product [Phytophthora fragariaefolia]